MTNLAWARLLAYLLVIVVACGTTVLITEHSIHRVNSVSTESIQRLRDAEFLTCERIQVLRDQANGTNFLIYDTFKRVVDQQRGLVKSGMLKGSVLKQTRQGIKRAEQVVNTTVVTGPTSCVKAITDPTTYIPPAPEFIKLNNAHIREARRRANEIVHKAKTGQPLYNPFPTDPFKSLNDKP